MLREIFISSLENIGSLQRQNTQGKHCCLFLATDKEEKIKRINLWLPEEQALSLCHSVCVCVCLCVTESVVKGGSVIAEGRKSKGRENNSSYSLDPLPLCFSETLLCRNVPPFLHIFSPRSGTFIFLSIFLLFLYLPNFHSYSLDPRFSCTQFCQEQSKIPAKAFPISLMVFFFFLRWLLVPVT